jgi:hypothetical protein
MPIKIKNSETMISKYNGSLKAAPRKSEVFLLGSRGLTVMLENVISGIMTKPMTRIDHPNPRDESFNILDSAMGNMTPPIEDPETAIPKAAALFLSKYWDRAAKAGIWRNAIEVPMRTPWASMKCQYSVHKLVIIVAKT